MDKVLLGVIIVGGVGFGISAAASAVESRLLRWRVARA
jgi:ABC-type nitrate/sulfonate/bicarbonate transport system permease component